MISFSAGDLIAIENTDGTCGYGIIIESKSQFGYVELRVLYIEKVMSLIYDGRKNTIKLIQSLD